MSASRLVRLWRRIPRRIRIGYAIVWLLASVVFSGIYAAAWSTTLDRLVLLPILLGAFWPLTIPALIIYLASG